MRINASGDVTKLGYTSIYMGHVISNCQLVVRLNVRLVNYINGHL